MAVSGCRIGAAFYESRGDPRDHTPTTPSCSGARVHEALLIQKKKKGKRYQSFEN